ncbi:MAG: hypothetical protein EBU33_10745 [Sphingobacteriia bacterium]|nr:hypothetical protein [Sphingobacteriia bacterium]
MSRVKMLVTCQKNHGIKVGIFLLLKDMRKLILVSATSFEIEPTLQFLSEYRVNGQVYQLGNLQIQACITGVGMINTAFELGRCGAQQFDLALNAGLAGCFGNRPKGSVLNIVSDCFSELGAQDDERFLTIDELGLGEKCYSGGQALFSATDPTKLLDRTDVPFIKPELPWEKSGQYQAGTTFIEGLVLFRNQWLLYYGCADTFVGVAMSPVQPWQLQSPSSTIF